MHNIFMSCIIQTINVLKFCILCDLSMSYINYLNDLYHLMCLLIQHFKREEQKFVSHNEIDNMALIMPNEAIRMSARATNMARADTDSVKESSRRHGGRRKERKTCLEAHNSLNVACLKRLVPVGLAFLNGRDQELLQQAKQRLLLVCVLNVLI